MNKTRTLFLMVLFPLAAYCASRGTVSYEEPAPTTQTDTTPSKPIQYAKPKGDLGKFLTSMGKAEGLGSYQTVSRTGYLGMYQFHPTTLKKLGFDVTKEEFLNNPALQDSAMIKFMKEHSRALKNVIQEFNGTYYNDVYITKSGILAGAHLVGMGGILSYFYPDKYNYRTYDGNGVTAELYIKKFGGYDLRGI